MSRLHPKNLRFEKRQGRKTLVSRLEWLESRTLLSTGMGNPYLVTSALSDGPGSLRQAIESANAAPVDGSPIVIQFDIPVSAGSSVASIVLDSSLPALTRPNVSIDGSSEVIPGYTPALMGAGGVVGTGGDPLVKVVQPTVELLRSPSATIAVGIELAAADQTIFGLAITGFGLASGSANSANILVDATASGASIGGNVIGTRAASFSDPGGSYRSAGDGIRVLGATGGHIENNLIGYGYGQGVDLASGATGWLVQQNEVRAQGFQSATNDGIDVESGSALNVISGNLITGTWACGVDTLSSGGHNQI
ncbi:MAG TPA: right-handed parallel beta-helix repeat-containing protein, partial [Isosphaeraceae bacterium]|nr:right-handed parallel beta-helix repeat-containing protein [Isosphaeraceae bacterium]